MPPSISRWFAGSSRKNKAPWLSVLVASLLASAVIYYLDVSLGDGSHVELVDRADFAIPVCHVGARPEFEVWFPFAPGGADTALLCSDRSPFGIQHQLFRWLPLRLAYPAFCVFHGVIFSLGTCLLVSRFGRDVPTLAIVAIALTPQCISTHFRGPYPCFGVADALTPLIAWALYVLSDRPGMLRWGAALAVGVVAGANISPIVLPFLITGVATCFVVAPPKSITALVTAGGLVAAGCFAAVWGELTTLLLFVPESHRSLWNMYHQEIHGVFREWNRISGFFIGHWALVAATLAGAGLRGPHRQAIIRSAGILLILVAGLSVYPFIWLEFRDYLGPIASVQLSRLTRFVAPSVLAVGAVLGLQSLYESRAQAASAGKALSILGGLLTVAMVISVAWGGASRVLHKSAELRKGYTYARVFQNRGIADVSELAAAEQVRVAVVSGDFLRPGILWAYGIETAGGGGLHSMRYHRYWGHVIADELAVRDRERVYFWNWGNKLSLRPTPHGALFEEMYDTHLLALANVGYVISERPTPSNILSLVIEGEGVRPYVYRLPGVIPRVFLASTDGVDWAEDSFTNDESLDWKEMIDRTRSEIAHGEFGTVRDPGQAVQGRFTFDVQASAPCTLVVLCRYSTFCRATVNGNPSPVRPAFGAFVGVEVPPGKHRVKVFMNRNATSFPELNN